MNWLFGGGSDTRRQAQTPAVTGVSSDYYSHHDLPVAVAVPIGSEGSNHHRVTTAYASPLPPPTNPAYKSTRPPSTAAPPPTTGAVASSQGTPSAPTLAAFGSSIPSPPTEVLSTPSRPQAPQSPPTRIPIGFTAPPTIIPANNSVVLPLVATTPAARMVPTTAATATAAAAPPMARQFSPLPLHFGRRPCFLSACPYCQSVNVRTRLQTFPNWKTWIAVILIALVFWPLAWIPLVVDCTKSTDHYCPNCHALVGSVGAFEDACVKHRR